MKRWSRVVCNDDAHDFYSWTIILVGVVFICFTFWVWRRSIWFGASLLISVDDIDGERKEASYDSSPQHNQGNNWTAKAKRDGDMVHTYIQFGQTTLGEFISIHKNLTTLRLI